MVSPEEAQRAAAARRAYEWVKATVPDLRENALRVFLRDTFSEQRALETWAQLRAQNDVLNRLELDMEMGKDE